MDSRQVMMANNERLAKIINPLPQHKDQENVYFHRLIGYCDRASSDFGILEMCPDYQRGHVWSDEQQLRYVENVIRGAVPLTGMVIQFNCPNLTNPDFDAVDLPKGWQCMDGLQRYTAVARALDGDIKPFGLNADDLAGSCFSFDNFYFTVRIFEYKTRAEVLKHYLDINSGGTPHSEAELARVRELYRQALGG
ncbi:DUF262 domain-containing protein [Pseudomonas aeruginosa]